MTAPRLVAQVPGGGGRSHFVVIVDRSARRGQTTFHRADGTETKDSRARGHMHYLYDTQHECYWAGKTDEELEDVLIVALGGLVRTTGATGDRPPQASVKATPDGKLIVWRLAGSRGTVKVDRRGRITEANSVGGAFTQRISIRYPQRVALRPVPSQSQLCRPEAS